MNKNIVALPALGDQDEGLVSWREGKMANKQPSAAPPRRVPRCATCEEVLWDARRLFPGQVRRLGHQIRLWETDVLRIGTLSASPP